GSLASRFNQLPQRVGSVGLLCYDEVCPVTTRSTARYRLCLPQTRGMAEASPVSHSRTTCRRLCRLARHGPARLQGQVKRMDGRVARSTEDIWWRLMLRLERQQPVSGGAHCAVARVDEKQAVRCEYGVGIDRTAFAFGAVDP